MKTFRDLKPNDIVYNCHTGYVFEKTVFTIHTCDFSDDAIDVVFYGDEFKTTLVCDISSDSGYHTCLESIRELMESYMVSLEKFEKKEVVSC